MKKVLSFVLATMLVVCFAGMLTVSAAEYLSWDAYGKGQNANFDSLQLNGSAVCNNDGDSIFAYLSEIDRTISDAEGKVNAITIEGWAGFDQAITAAGYSIDGATPVTEGCSFRAAEEGVVAAAGENAVRFTVVIPVDRLAGKHTITPVMKLADGTFVALNRVEPATQNLEFAYEGPADDPNTAYRSWAAYRKGVNTSFDNFYINGELIMSEGSKILEYLEGIDRTISDEEGTVSVISVAGWTGFDQEIVAAGYSIDGAEPVLSGTLSEANEGIRAAGGNLASKFAIDIPVAELKGTHTIVPVVKLADGTMVALNREDPANQNMSLVYAGPADNSGNDDNSENNDNSGNKEENPATGDVSVIMFAAIAVAGALVVVRRKIAE